MEWRLCGLLSLVILVSLVPHNASPNYNEEPINFALVHVWAEKLGQELWHFGEYITRRKDVENSYKTAQVETRDGRKLVEQMASDIKNMMELKVSAVRRIMDAAENMAESQQREVVPEKFQYYNSKRIEQYEPYLEPTPEPPPRREGEPPRVIMRQMVLRPSLHFNNKSVNTSYSSVHMPTNVYDWSPEVIQAIRWSENLDSIFINNYRADPSLSWQYFGSSSGFMRHYPAMQWKAEPVDLFDCRTRAWYIEAATSPKDVVVLVDSSGSMTGQQRDIARHVVSNILDTLGNNDFVNIFTFNDTVLEVVPCFNQTLVQATLANVRELKLGMESIETTGIANFSAALTHAFQLLELYRETQEGASCNQAIMLVSDGVPYNYKEIFEQYNWRDRPMMPVRVFTYLIGREVADVREVKWMACANQGYYVHLSTLAEVREQVLQYVPVMARPLVLWGQEHPVIWTPVYADITDPKMTDYLWEERESEDQKERIMSHRRNSALFKSKEEQDRRFVLKQRRNEDQVSDLQAYQLMTSVSMPVFDRRENASRVANLLGVAGTDVPIQDIQALMMPYQLGVNGYAFIVTNNGYILTHPDLRPVFQGILKPSYNSVDMMEVELVDDNRGPRDFNPDMMQVRNEVINQSTGSTRLHMKHHFDDMKRASRLRRQYHWTGIPDSPFTLVVSLPEPYGMMRLSLRPEDDIHRNHLKGQNAAHYFHGSWRVHPEWLYCRHHEKTFDSPEEELLYFLERMRQPGWRWPLKPRPPEHMHSNTSAGKSEPKPERDTYFCDRSLMQAVVFDARVTEWFSQNITGSKDDKGKEIINRYGITVAFMATHSGLTRWQTFTPQPASNTEEKLRPEFGEIYPRATDEVWYKRAVEQHYTKPRSFVYSVGFDTGEWTPGTAPGPVVMAAHAVFHTVGNVSAPAAVVGFQFHHTSLHTMFTNITSSCMEITPCQKTCKSDELECYVVDNNGFVVVSEQLKDTGRFFGEVRAPIMRQLVEERIYRPVQITDYQAVCFQERDTFNPAPKMFTPFGHLHELLSWLASYLIWFWQHSAILGTHAYGYSYPNEEVNYPSYEGETENTNEGEGNYRFPATRAKERDFDELVLINRTRPTPCDQEVWLYQLQQYADMDGSPYKSNAKGCERPYVVQPVAGSNLILVVVDALCPQDELAPPLRQMPLPVQRNGSLPCERAARTPLPRRRLESCIKHHPNESLIELCGRGASIGESWKLLLVLFLTVTFLFDTFFVNQNLN